ncbi:hypothetical protein BDZ94DRAFT_1253286 [Collybia nuda]|uniref:Telomere-associated protein Rif1 N-terminal domain-containing protein n=1 Tax=Collybia nuda TaxID=64659 RepID=A0A9P5YAQ7_9AGAR|nr:hypothetical protein BDZ94DRAFT_1253286 [Collybia nuda]
MNTLVLAKSRKGNLSIEAPTSRKIKISGFRPLEPAGYYITVPTLMVEPMTTKSTNINHLLSTEFLLSPLETVLESICDPGLDNVSLHDLIEAYSTLSARIRSQARSLLDDQPLPAIEALREHSSSLTHALKRDLRRILFESGPPTQESTLTDTPILTDIQFTRDMAALCLHALCFLSDVFVFKALYSVFSKNELHELLATLLELTLVEDLATPSRQKTWTLVIWILQVQNLPSTTLDHEKASLVAALRRAIDGELGSQARLDGLKAIPHLLTHHYTFFITPFVELLPSILDCLVSDSVDCRMNAVTSLCGFGLAKVNSLTSSAYPHDRVADAVHAFISLQTSRSETSQDEPSLPSMVKTSLSGRTNPAWALTVIAAIIVLLDYSLFLRPGSIKFCLNNLAYVASHEYSDVAALHSHIWRILVWALLRIPFDIEWSHVKRAKSKGDPRVSASKVVAQMLRGGVGTALASSLLGASNDTMNPGMASDNIMKALEVVREMVAGKSGSNPEEGLLLLSRLVSTIGTASHSTTVTVEEWEKNHLPSTSLLNGTVLHSTVKKLGSVVRGMEVVKIDRVRPLSEAEIVTNWDSLVTIWASSVKFALGKPLFQLWGELVHVWQSLLLAQADLAEQDGHLTASSVFAKRVASIMAQFLPEDLSGTTVNHLDLLKKLWNVVKNIFSSSWLHSPAEIILATVLMRQFSFQDNNVKSAWSELCADLISAGIPSILHVVSSRSDLGQGLEMTRQLWTVLAKAWQTSDEGLPWGNVAAFLAIPYRWGLSVAKTPVNVDVASSVWDMSDTEIELWDEVLRSAVALAGAASVKPVDVITSVLQRIGVDRVELLSASPKTITSILSHVDISVGDTLPLEIFSLVDLVLVSHYSISKSEFLPTLVEILFSLGRIIATASPPMLLQLLAAVEQGLYLWIRDEREVLPQTQHDALVTSVYCRTLATLRHQEPTLNTLISISTFLTSGFGRLHEPLIGPLAFEDFWRATYHNIDGLRPHYSESLRNCLLAFSDTWGGSMGDGLSNCSESQKTKMSTVPDSQPPRYDAQGSWGYPVYANSHPGLSSSPKTVPTSSLRHTPETSAPAAERAAKRRKLDHPAHLVALNELQQYSSYRDESNIQNVDPPVGESLVHPRLQTPFSAIGYTSVPDTKHTSLASIIHPTNLNANQPDGFKRSANAGDHRSPKRRKTEIGYDSGLVAPSFSRTQSDGPRQLGRNPQDRLKLKSVQSEPIFSAHYPYDNDSQTTEYRKRKMVLDWVATPVNREGHPSLPIKSPPNTPEKAQAHRASSQDASLADPSSPEDYNSWEASVPIEEIKRIQHELSGSDHSFHEASMGIEDEPDDDITDALSELLDPDILSNPSGAPSIRPQLGQLRSQTAPGSIPARSPLRPRTLRRHQTTSTRLNIDGLLQTCAAVEDDASQAPVADLMHATALINKIGTKLTEHLTRRLIGQAPQPD